MDKISVVMPVYNGADFIEKVVKDYHEKVVSKISGSEFIIAEDGSTDGTKEILARLAKKYNLRLVSGDGRKGYVRAVKDALKLPKNNIVFFSDSDNSHDPADFWNLYPKLKDHDLVVGYKKDRQDPFYRILVSRVNNLIIGVLFGLWLHDSNCGFRVMRRKVIRDVLPQARVLRIAFSSEFTIRAKKEGYRVCEVPIQHFPADTNFFSPLQMPKVIIKELWDLFKLRIVI